MEFFLPIFWEFKKHCAKHRNNIYGLKIGFFGKINDINHSAMTGLYYTKVCQNISLGTISKFLFRERSDGGRGSEMPPHPPFNTTWSVWGGKYVLPLHARLVPYCRTSQNNQKKLTGCLSICVSVCLQFFLGGNWWVLFLEAITLGNEEVPFLKLDLNLSLTYKKLHWIWEP